MNTDQLLEKYLQKFGVKTSQELYPILVLRRDKYNKGLSNPHIPSDLKEDVKKNLEEINQLIKHLDSHEAKEPEKPKKEAPKRVGIPNRRPKTTTKPSTGTATAEVEADLYWNKPTKEKDLAQFGEVKELTVLPNMCRKKGITLEKDIKVFVKGDVVVTAQKGELIEMVHVGGDDWQQFNIIANPSDKCVAISGPNYVKHRCGSYQTTDPNIPPTDDSCNRLIDENSLKALDAYLKKATSTKQMHTVAGKYTAERRILHMEILKKLTGGNTCIKRTNPVAIFMGGKPGAGKSTFVKKKLNWLTSEDIYKLDADEVREYLPEYEGWNAAITHNEVQDLLKGYEGFDGLLSYAGKDCKWDLLLDGTMTSPNYFKTNYQKLKDLGYKIYVIYIDVDSQKSRQRANARYQKSGRYVPQFVLDEADEAGKKAFDEIKDQADGYWLVDGETHEIIDQGGSPIPKDRNYSELGKDLKTKPKAQNPEQKTNKIIAQYLALQAEENRLGVAENKVVEVWRKKSGPAVFVKEDKNKKRSYYTIDEKTKIVSPVELDESSKSSLILIDAIDKKGGKAEGLLQKIYKHQTEQVACLDIEAAIQECRSGTCSAAEVEYYKEMAKECRHQARRARFVEGISRLFDEIFRHQLPKQKFEEAYNKQIKKA